MNYSFAKTDILSREKNVHSLCTKKSEQNAMGAKTLNNNNQQP
jgi:hypothetical protein